MTSFYPHFSPNCEEFYKLRQWSHFKGYLASSLKGRMKHLNDDFEGSLFVGDDRIAERICMIHNHDVIMLHDEVNHALRQNAGNAANGTS